MHTRNRVRSNHSLSDLPRHIGLPPKRTPKTPLSAASRTADAPGENTPSRTNQPQIQPLAPPPKKDITFFCPTCAAKLVVTERAAGRSILCKCCGSQIIVPSGSASPKQGIASPIVPTTPPAKETVEELIEKLRNGDEQAGMALIRMGEAMIPLMIEGFNEYRLEDPDTNIGAANIVRMLTKCGGVCVQPLIAKLGKSRHAYYALGKIGTTDAVNALVRELSSVNWRRVAVACTALGQVENQNVLKVVDKIEEIRKSTRVGEVFTAAGASLDAIKTRFPNAKVSDTTLPQAQPLKATIAISTVD